MEYSSGEMLVYASSFTQEELKPVSIAAERVAKLMKLGFQVKTFGKNLGSIYVYYRFGHEDPIPIYCSSNKIPNTEQVYRALRNMMFVLSFHPKHEALKSAARGFMRSS